MCPSSTAARGNIRCASGRSDATPEREPTRRSVAPWSQNVSTSPEVLHGTKEPDMARHCTREETCGDRTLTTAQLGRQDKSREVRDSRSVGKGTMIKDLAQCAPEQQSLPIRTSLCEC